MRIVREDYCTTRYGRIRASRVSVQTSYGSLPPTSVKDVFSRQIRVLVVDDHPAIREALAFTVRDKIDMELCGQASTAAEAIQCISDTTPDVVIVDISLKDAHGLDLVQRIRAPPCLSLGQRRIAL